MACVGVSWYVLACFGVSWRVLACFGVSRRVLACLGVFGRVLACFGVFWRILACLGVFWRVLACLGVCFHVSKMPMSHLVSCFRKSVDVLAYSGMSFDIFAMSHGEVGGWGRVPFSRNLMKPTPRRKWYLTTGRRFH